MWTRARYGAALALATLVLVGCTDGAYDVEGARAEMNELTQYTRSRDAWEPRAAAVRAGILRGAGLDVLPPRTPLELVSHGLRVRDGYTIEDVAFESLPGVYVTGNLYRPLGRSGPRPAVLNPHGHFYEAGWYARTRPDMQARSAHLAQMGAVVLAYDMVGWGDDTQIPHHTDWVLALQLWNSIRAVDLLESLPEVDGARIGVTGASGGATQTILLAAVDPRIAVSAPVAMVTAAYDGGDVCEVGMPIRDAPRTNNTEIAALIAPRPLLVVSDGGDWTRDFPDLDAPFVRAVYHLYDADDEFRNVHFPDQGHDYGADKRAAMYEFFAAHLGLDPVAIDDPAPESQASLVVFDDAHPRPADAVVDPAEIARRLFVAP